MISPRAHTAVQVLVGIVLGLAAAAVFGRSCERAVPDVPGERVEVHPAIRALEAGVRDR